MLSLSSTLCGREVTLMSDAVRLDARISEQNRTGERGVDAPIPALTTNDKASVNHG